MKKKTIIIITAASGAVLVCLITVFIIFYKKQKAEAYREVAVVVNHWNDTHHADYTICTVNGITSFSTGSTPSTGWFKTDMSIEDMLATNAEDYIGRRRICFEGSLILKEPVEAYLFYSDNNYYFFYWREESKRYVMGNLSAAWTADGQYGADIRFPFPEPLVIGSSFSNEKVVYLFENHDFADLKEFYSRISEEYYTIDEENQVITVKAYGNTNNLSWEGGYRHEIEIDCKNRTITGPSRHNGPLTVK